jgi:hypothetical protein
MVDDGVARLERLEAAEPVGKDLSVFRVPKVQIPEEFVVWI